jgi:hypothetical protein
LLLEDMFDHWECPPIDQMTFEWSHRNHHHPPSPRSRLAVKNDCDLSLVYA